jgi:MFS family permease
MNEVAAPRRAWFSLSVFGFGVASFLSDLGHEAATAAMPALLVAIGSTPAALGIIEGVADGLASVAKLAGGWWSDDPRRRKPIAVAGYFITGLSKGAYALATVWPHLLLARSIGWMARGMRGPARDAMLADAVPGEARGRAFGFHRAMDTAGAALGPALASVLLATVSLREVFLWTLVPGVLSAIAFAALVKRDEGPPLRPQPFWKSLGALPRRFRRFLLAVFTFGIGDFARTLLILRATDLLTPGLGAVQAATVAMSMYAGHNVLYAAASYPIGWLADRFDAKRLLVLGYLLGTLTAVLACVTAPSLWMLGLLFGVSSLTLAFEDTLEATITAQAVPSELRGTGYGVLATANGVGDLVSSSLVGVLWSTAGAEVAFGVAAAFCFVGTVLLGASRSAGET